MITVKKVLNNNVIIAEHSQYDEIVLIGKGLGFGKKTGDEVAGQKAEKFFVLKDAQEQQQYINLLEYVDESFIEMMNDFIGKIEERFQTSLNEHIHVGLTDHLYFAIKRIKQGMDVKNPFGRETELAYPKEYAMATEIVEALNDKLNMKIPTGEIGFIALHIHSALSNRALNEINKHTMLVTELVNMIEDNLKITIDKQDMNYLRLVRHLHHTIDRVTSGNYMEEQDALKKVLQEEYPICYTLSWKLMRVMQQKLQKPVPDAESVYLTLHIQRLYNKI
ncbi:glucose PTS transporter transcription antiterminator GlcT [Evansella cellulosilytica]|uniref:Transcriptional antiterminator, BglG n=1 Tax=Evansella cellulosilytica (strain ATCC 21833 / DSM 2522 / FERM P-1141 / JCM 9156 / N-4) TaxID=649639 RepID=E6TS61_EVAC2|nr:transcription antiterminator [Evansella cellulosilytica]ADU31830.1 transcriptional antiterminator, BglG [Evansella cellulosilytica DSM 2522]